MLSNRAHLLSRSPKLAPAVFFAVAAMLGAQSTSALARDRYRSSSFNFDRDQNSESMHTISVAGGVAAPSESVIRGENPAGLIYNRAPKVIGFLSSGPERKEDLSNGFELAGGDGEAAARIGVQTVNNVKDGSGSLTYFNFGLATKIDPINMALGLDGSYRFRKEGTQLNPNTEPTWTADLGLLYNPEGDFRAGLNLYDLSRGVTAFGLGFSSYLNPLSVLAFDMSINNHGQGLTLKPGLGVQAASLQITYAYGMQVDKSATSGISVGNTLGLGYEFNSTLRMQAYYNHVSLYYLGLTIAF